MSTENECYQFAWVILSLKSAQTCKHCTLHTVIFKHFGAVTYLFYSLITPSLHFSGCSLGQTIIQPVLRSERRRDRLPLAAQGRAWTLSACPPVTPAARRTARVSLRPRLTPLTLNKTRWVMAFSIIDLLLMFINHDIRLLL